MFCPNCGKEVPEGRKFCGNCGWSVGSNIVAKSNEAVKQVTTVIAGKASKAKDGANKKIGKFRSWLGDKDNKFYFLAMIFMSASIFIAKFAPAITVTSVRQGKHFEGNGFLPKIGNFLGNLIVGTPADVYYEETIYNPFKFNGLAAVLAVILYSIVMYRNKNTEMHFDKHNIDKRIMLLHLLNLIFLLTVCSLFTTESKMFLPFMENPVNPIYVVAIAVLLSTISMKSLAGIFWIVAVVAILTNLNQFNRWEDYSAAYVICAYISLIIQVLILKIFSIDFEHLREDFMTPAKHVKSDVQATIDTGSKAINIAKDATKVAITATTGVPVAAIPSANNKSNNKTEG